MSKGSLFIVNTQKMDQIYTRLTVSRASVKFIHYIPERQLFISICEEQILKFWTINGDERKITVHYEWPCYRQVSHIESIHSTTNGSNFILAFASGDFEVFNVNSQNHVMRRASLSPARQVMHMQKITVQKVETDKGREHDSSLTAVDYHPLMELLVTSCQEGVIKVWKMPYKLLVKEIQFPARVDAVCFRNKHKLVTQRPRKKLTKSSQILEEEEDEDESEAGELTSEGFQTEEEDSHEESEGLSEEQGSEMKKIKLGASRKAKKRLSDLEDDQEQETFTFCGDILVAHEKRVSMIKYETYFTGEDEIRISS